MCVVSMVGDHYADKWRNIMQPQFPHVPQTPQQQFIIHTPISREEFDALKRDVEEMKALLKRAKEYDERNNEPECEIEEKMDLLRKVAKAVGVDLDDVLGPHSDQSNTENELSRGGPRGLTEGTSN